MKLRRVGIISMVFALAIGGGTHNMAYAMELQEQALINNNNIISPFWNSISDINASISSNSTVLYPEVYVEAMSSTGVISGTMYLEKYVSGKWTTVTSWGVSGKGSAFLTKTYQGTSGTSYRVRVAVTVNGEKAEAFSKTCAL